MHLISSIDSSIKEEIHCLEGQLWRLDEEYWDAVFREALLCQALEEVELDEVDIDDLLAYHKFIKSEFKEIDRKVSYLNKKIANLHTKGEAKESTPPKDNPLPTRKRQGRYMKPRRDYGYNWVNTISHYRVAR